MVTRQPWTLTAVEHAEIVIMCKRRRGGFKCQRLAPLRRTESQHDD